MADVSHTSVGFTGTVDQVAEARRFVFTGVPFRVASSADWAVTVVAGSNRTVQVAAGAGQACGVRDATVAPATFASAANASGSTRLDVLVATFNWSTGATSFGIIQGTTSLPVINTGGSVIAGQINRIPGVQYDAILAVLSVRNGVGAFATTDVFDCRLWGGFGGMLQIPTATYRTILDVSAGSEIKAADTLLQYRYTGSAWIASGLPVLTAIANRPTAASAGAGAMICTTDLPGCPVFVSDGSAWYQLGIMPGGGGWTSVPANAYVFAQDVTYVGPTLNSAGAINVNLPVTYSALPVIVDAFPGDNASGFQQAYPILNNSSGSAIQCVCQTGNGTALASGLTVRINVRVIGYHT